MSEYLFPTPGRALRKLLDNYALCNEDKWPEYLCVQDIMLAMDREDIKPLRYYAKRWNRSKSWVDRNLDSLKQEADKQRKFHKKWDKVGQEWDKPRQESASNAIKNGKVRQEWDSVGQRWDSIEQIQIPDTYNKGTNVPVVLKDKIDWKSRYAEVMNSWNTFAQSNNLSSITKLSENRRKWIRSRYDSIMPHIETIYRNLSASDFHMGRTAEFAGVTFETLWRNKEHYLRYIEMKPKKRRPEAMEFVGSKYVGSSTELKQAYHNGQAGTAYRSARDKR